MVEQLILLATVHLQRISYQTESQPFTKLQSKSWVTDKIVFEPLVAEYLHLHQSSSTHLDFGH